VVHRYPLGGVVVEFRFHSASFRCLWWQVVVIRIFFYLSLICL
jgi:hypothetical protein